MKVHEDLIPYLKGILKNPCLHGRNELNSSNIDEATPVFWVRDNPRNAYSFLSLDERDYRRVAQLFRQEIDGDGKRKKALISAFEDAADKTASGEHVDQICAYTQDDFVARTDLSCPHANFYRAISAALGYRQKYSKKYEWGWNKANKVMNLIEDDLIKLIKSQINSFLDYQKNERSVIAFRENADVVEAKAKEQKKELSNFDFAAFEQLIATSGEQQ